MVWMDPVLLVVRSMSGQLEDRSILAQSVRRLVGVALLVPLAIATPACSSNGNKSGDESACPDWPAEVVEERPVELSYRGPSQDVDALVARRTPRLVVQGGQPRSARLALDRKDALDVDLPPGGDCRGGHNPVFSVAYMSPPVGSTPNWTSRLHQHNHDQAGTGTAWAVIDVQSQRAWGDITVYDSQPMWG